jgi:hypothetical protein
MADRTLCSAHCRFSNFAPVDSIDFTVACSSTIRVLIKDKVVRSCGLGKEDVVPQVGIVYGQTGLQACRHACMHACMPETARTKHIQQIAA